MVPAQVRGFMEMRARVYSAEDARVKGKRSLPRRALEPQRTLLTGARATDNLYHLFLVFYDDRLRNRFVEIFKMDVVSVRRADSITVRALIRRRRRSVAEERKCFTG